MFAVEIVHIHDFVQPPLLLQHALQDLALLGFGEVIGLAVLRTAQRESQVRLVLVEHFGQSQDLGGSFVLELIIQLRRRSLVCALGNWQLHITVGVCGR